MIDSLERYLGQFAGDTADDAPTPSSDYVKCPECHGERFIIVVYHREEVAVTCPTCHGVGYVHFTKVSDDE